MAGTVLDREDSLTIYDECRPPFGSVIKRRESERFRAVVRLLKAWGVMNRANRKKCSIPRRKIRRVFYEGWYNTPQIAEANFIASLLVASKTGAKRTALEEELQSVFDSLSAFKKIVDVDDEYTFKPTPRAHIKTKLALMDIYTRMGRRFPLPHMVADGEGGIVADWQRNGRRVRLRFRPTGEQRDYIYYQSENEYDVETATTENLERRLEWLLSA